MKELIFKIKVLLFAIPMLIGVFIPDEWFAAHHLQTPAFAFVILLFIYYLYLIHFPLRYHEPFVKPYKGFDPNFKVVRFNPSPFMVFIICMSAIIQANKEVTNWVFIQLVMAFLLFKVCEKHGFLPIQSWYESPDGKLLRIEKF